MRYILLICHSIFVHNCLISDQIVTCLYVLKCCSLDILSIKTLLFMEKFPWRNMVYCTRCWVSDSTGFSMEMTDFWEFCWQMILSWLILLFWQTWEGQSWLLKLQSSLAYSIRWKYLAQRNLSCGMTFSSSFRKVSSKNNDQVPLLSDWYSKYAYGAWLIKI